MLFRKPLFVFILQMLCCVHAKAQSPDRKSVRDSLLVLDVNRILQGKVDSNKIPGAVIEVRQEGRIIYEQAYGWAQKFDFNHRLLSSPAVLPLSLYMPIETMWNVVQALLFSGTGVTKTACLMNHLTMRRW